MVCLAVGQIPAWAYVGDLEPPASETSKPIPEIASRLFSMYYFNVYAIIEESLPCRE